MQIKLHQIFTLAGIISSAAWFTLCDKFFHIDMDILVYYWHPKDVIFQGQSVWTFPIFACATTGFYFATRPFVSSWKENPGYLTLIVNGAICTLAYYGSGIMGNSHPMIYFWVVIGIWVVRIFYTTENRNTAIKACLVMAFLGCFWEGALSKIGYFDYYYRNIFNVPLWLFACYLHAGFLMLEMQAFVNYLNRSGK